MTELGYSLACYSTDGLRDIQQALPGLRALGFPWVVLTPTYGVRDGQTLSFAPEFAPDSGLFADTAMQASELGFHIRFEPHLDWVATLNGGVYEWRRRMFFAPGDALRYSEQVLVPLKELSAKLLGNRPKQRVQITLGSELDVSLTVFSQANQGWAETLSALRRDATCEFGHKINHDLLDWNDGLLNDLRSEQAKRGLSTWSKSDYRKASQGVRGYLAALDYVGVSFYPSLPLKRDDEWWRQPATEDSLQEIAAAFNQAITRQAQPILSLGGPAFSIGEFGLGATDPQNSYRVDAKSFLDPDGSMNPGAREMRRSYYVGFLRSLLKADRELNGEPACFWTVGHFDIVQAQWRQGFEAFADPQLIATVGEYNAGRLGN